MITVKRALVSVSDKTGLIEFCRFLIDQGVEIISTGGTQEMLQKEGVRAISVENYTGFPEMMDGRLKTLHPRIHGGLLALRDRQTHQNALAEHGIKPIDLLLVNLYPFAATIAGNESNFQEAVENIDIGGPTMLRAAAKNFRFTVSLCDPKDYARIQKEIAEEGGVSEETSLSMAKKVFNHTASYDALIAGYLNNQAEDSFPDTLTLTFEKLQNLRYGENPHQTAAYYRPVLDLVREKTTGLSGTAQLQGKELSFNNLLDFSSALYAVLSLPGPGAVLVKHLNPCGAATVANGFGLKEAFINARKCDPISAFGGVIAISGTVDKEIAGAITENFAEGVIAPDFTQDALEIFATKKNLRLLKVENPDQFRTSGHEIRQVYNGILYQDTDSAYAEKSDWRIVTERKPDEKMTQGLEFAWRLVKHVKSNAIVFCSRNASLGIGAGQMSRIDSVEIAVMKSKKNGLDLKNSVVASDAFFPFRDGIDAIADAGALAIIQPGGSIRDDDAIQACNERGMAMIFTGMRHFRH